jgi:hypothetical protein
MPTPMTAIITHDDMMTFISAHETHYVDVLTPEMKHANCRYFLETLITLCEGGVYTWRDTGFKYTKKNKKFYPESPSAYAQMAWNTTDKFMKNFVVYEHNFSG